MRTLKTLYKRSFALFLAVALCVSTPQLTVFAEGTSDTDTTETSDTGSSETSGDESGGDESNDDGTTEETSDSGTSGDDVDSDAEGDDDNAAGETPDQGNGSGEGSLTDAADGEDPAQENLLPDGNADAKAAGSEDGIDLPNDEDSEDTSEATKKVISVDTTNVVQISEDGRPIAPPGFTLYKQGDEEGSIFWTFAEVDEDGNIKVDEKGPLSTWKVTEVRDPESGEVIGYAVKTFEASVIPLPTNPQKPDDSQNPGESQDPDESQDSDESQDPQPDLTVGPTDSEAVVSDPQQPTPPEGYDKNEENVYIKDNGDGSVSEWGTTAVKDSSGKTIGYKTVTTTKAEKTESGKAVKPSSGTTVDESGNVTVVNVHSFNDKQKNETAYRITRVTTSADGLTVTTEVIYVDKVNDTTTTTTTVTNSEFKAEQAITVDEAEFAKRLEPSSPPEGFTPSKEDKDTFVKMNFDGENSVVETWNWEECIENGALVGYKTIEKREETIVETKEAKVESKLEYPEGPVQNEDGSVTVTTVTDTKDGMGYVVTTVTTSADGRHIITRTETVSGGIITTKTTTTTITETTWKVESSEDGQISVVISKVEGSENHGALDTSSIIPTVGKPAAGVNNTQSDLYGAENGKPVAVDGDYILKWQGEYGLESAVLVGTTDGKYKVHQFILYDASGKPHYVYCADVATSVTNGTVYNMVNVEDAEYLSPEQREKISAIAENGYWATSSDKHEQGSLSEFKSWLVNNGFYEWLQETGWDDVYQKLDEVDLANLTGGIAMSVTQAAIWYYASSDESEVKVKDSKDVFTHYHINLPNGSGDNYYTYDKVEELWNKGANKKLYSIFHSNKDVLAQIIYEFLTDDEVNLKDTSESTDLIQISDITGTSITVTDQEVSENDGSTIYKADLSFILEVEPSRINDKDLLVTIRVGDQEYSYRLADAGKEDGWGKVESSKNATYTIKNLKLPNGATITLNLSGTQYVKPSAYLISAATGYESAQTFISVESGERSVNINLSLDFSVNEAEVIVSEDEIITGAVRTELSQSWSNSSEMSSEYREGDDDDGDDDDDDDDITDGDDDDDDDDDIVAFNDGDDDDDDDTEIPDEPTPLGNGPEGGADGDLVRVELAEIADELVPLTELPDEVVPLTVLLDDEVPLAGAEDLIELLDEDVPLADVPETGDISVLWYALILAAGGCLAALRITDAKKRRESLAD